MWASETYSRDFIMIYVDVDPIDNQVWVIRNVNNILVDPVSSSRDFCYDYITSYNRRKQIDRQKKKEKKMDDVVFCEDGRKVSSCFQ